MMNEILNNNTIMMTQDVHISEIKAGDTILHNGELRTVCHNNILFDKFIRNNHESNIP